MKGLILAGGTGSRLYPITQSVSKQLLPVYDKPMIFYPLFTLMSAGIREIAVITRPEEQSLFKKLLSNLCGLGVEITFLTQEKPNGISEAFLIGEEFIAGESAALILGDNLFVGAGLGRNLTNNTEISGCKTFVYPVANPEDYGNLEKNEDSGEIVLKEKPKNSNSNLAITGLYFFDCSVVERARYLQFSTRGELEIIDILQSYLNEKKFSYEILPRGTAWFDTGNAENLFSAGEYIRILQNRQNVMISCVEEIALLNKWITEPELISHAQNMPKSEYRKYIQKLASQRLGNSHE